MAETTCTKHNVLAPFTDRGIEYAEGDVASLDADTVAWLVKNAPDRIEAAPTDAEASHYALLTGPCGGCGTTQTRVS